jgi:NtrC-family two-component system sensor histidine kinase KinB
MRSLSQKIGLGYFVIICINVVIAVVAIYNINDLSKPIDQILKEKYQNVSSAENMIQALSQQELVHLSMLEDGMDSSLVINFQTYKNEFLNWHQRAIEGIALPSEPDILDSLIQTFDLYQSRSDSLILFISDKRSYRKNKIYHYEKIFPLVQQMERLCRHLKEKNEAAIAEADIKSQSISSRAKFFIIVFSVTLIIFSMIAGFYFTYKILTPIKKTTETVRKISRGQLNQKVEITTDDEVAELGLEFNRMTERLDAYEKMNIDQILQEKRKSEALVANIPVAILVTDSDFKLTLANELAESILGIPVKDSAGKQINELISEPELLDFIKGKIQSSLKETDPNKSLIQIQKDGTISYYYARQVDLEDATGQSSGKVTLLQDVTSFKNLDRLKSEFIATISHELKTPLTSMNMAIDILTREVPGKLNKEQKELLTGAKEDVVRLKNFVNDLLDISKLESGKISFNFEDIRPAKLIDYALKSFTLQIADKNIILKKDYNSTIGSLKADSTQLSRVFTNLIDNAVQHTRQNGTIKISIKKKNKDVLFCIADSGEGIPKDALDLIFDKFIQVKNFQQAGQGNIGLGLAIAREIIRAHQGKIWVESKQGSGSQFYVQIPIKQHDLITA